MRLFFCIVLRNEKQDHMRPFQSFLLLCSVLKCGYQLANLSSIHDAVIYLITSAFSTLLLQDVVLLFHFSLLNITTKIQYIICKLIFAIKFLFIEELYHVIQLPIFLMIFLPIRQVLIMECHNICLKFVQIYEFCTTKKPTMK